MALFSFKKAQKKSNIAASQAIQQDALETFLQGYSIEVMPRTAQKVTNFREFLAPGTRVYIAHIDETPIDDMVHTAKRIIEEGFTPMPHFPARIIKDKATLTNWVKRYRDIGVTQGLLLAGGLNHAQGVYENSMQLLESGAFDDFERLHVAGHPEKNKDIDPDGSDKMVMQAAKWKAAFNDRSDAKMAMVTQFCFEAQPVIEWAKKIGQEGINLPVHIGVAGPAKLQTLIKFSIACGVGASLRVLQKRAMDVTKLLLPYEPTQYLTELALYKAQNPNFAIEQVHFFPLGGIDANAKWIMEHGRAAGRPVCEFSN